MADAKAAEAKPVPETPTNTIEYGCISDLKKYIVDLEKAEKQEAKPVPTPPLSGKE